MFDKQCPAPVRWVLMSAAPSSKWYHNLWFVLAMLFFVLGPFGLPLLWKSPHFTRAWKWLLTILVLLYTLWLTVMSIRLFEAVYQRTQELLGALQ